MNWLIIAVCVLFAFCGYQAGYLVASAKWYNTIRDLNGRLKRLKSILDQVVDRAKEI